jgi:hypothetical protein
VTIRPMGASEVDQLGFAQAGRSDLIVFLFVSRSRLASSTLAGCIVFDTVGLLNLTTRRSHKVHK